MKYGTRVTTKYPVWIAMPCIGVTLLSGANYDKWNSNILTKEFAPKISYKEKWFVDLVS